MKLLAYKTLCQFFLAHPVYYINGTLVSANSC